MKRPRWFVAMVASISVGAALTLAPAGSGTSTGGCPSGDSWQLVTVASLGIPPEQASGIPSLDGNGDGLTCIMFVPNYPQPGTFVFRDNTVQG